MKQNILIILSLLLFPLVTFAVDPIFVKKSFSFEEIDHELNQEDIQNDSECLSYFSERKKKLLRKSLINPLIAVPTVPAATLTLSYTGAIIGKMVTGGTSWGSLVGSAWGTVVGVGGGLIFFTTREAVLITKYLNIQKMIYVIQESYGHPGPVLNLLQKKLENKGLKLSIEEIQREIISMDKTMTLCKTEKSNKRSLLTLERVSQHLTTCQKETK